MWIMNFNPKIILEFDPETFELDITLKHNTPAQRRRLKDFLEKNFPQGFSESKPNQESRQPFTE
jgi:hypothetical protein